MPGENRLGWNSMTKPSLLASLLLLFPGSLLHSQRETAESVRGVTVSTPGGGQDWASDEMVATLQDIKSLGGNWVTIHPYAQISDGNGRRGLAEGHVRSWSELDPENPPEYLARPIREAHALGLKILIKPHLAYWGTRYKWRGEIDFDSAEVYARFFETYETWIVQLAAVCKEADAFVVGTELDRTLGHEKEWRRIIRRVNAVTDGPLTYAANWDSYQRVPFWDALDVIGVQAYFPLSETPTGDLAELRAGWERVMKELRLYGEAQYRNIVFTEIGYNQTTLAGVSPWAYKTERGEQAQRIQEACLRVALDVIESEPRVVGSFLWKWFPAERHKPRDFNMRAPRVLEIIREAWLPASESE